MRRLFVVRFSEHLGPDERRTLTSNLEAKGLLIEKEANSDVRLVVFRESKVGFTRIQLANYERLGWLKWSEEEFTEPAP